MNLTLELVVIVDDDEGDIASLFTELLQVNSYFVIDFTNPLFIIYYIHNNPHQIQLVIIDYKMPLITGCELAKSNICNKPKNQNGLIKCI